MIPLTENDKPKEPSPKKKNTKELEIVLKTVLERLESLEHKLDELERQQRLILMESNEQDSALDQEVLMGKTRPLGYKKERTSIRWQTAYPTASDLLRMLPGVKMLHNPSIKSIRAMEMISSGRLAGSKSICIGVDLG